MQGAERPSTLCIVFDGVYAEETDHFFSPCGWNTVFSCPWHHRGSDCGHGCIVIIWRYLTRRCNECSLCFWTPLFKCWGFQAWFSDLPFHCETKGSSFQSEPMKPLSLRLQSVSAHTMFSLSLWMVTSQVMCACHNCIWKLLLQVSRTGFTAPFSTCLARDAAACYEIKSLPAGEHWQSHA